VEILASGEKEQLKKFIRWCENGPRNAHVEEVIVTKADKEYATEFRIIK
jgi:acylphosphatase